MMAGDLRGDDPANGLKANPNTIYDPTTGNPDGSGRQPIWATNNIADDRALQFAVPKRQVPQRHPHQPHQPRLGEIDELAAEGARTLSGAAPVHRRRAAIISPPPISLSIAPLPTKRSTGTPPTSSACSAMSDISLQRYGSATVRRSRRRPDQQLWRQRRKRRRVHSYGISYWRLRGYSEFRARRQLRLDTNGHKLAPVGSQYQPGAGYSRDSRHQRHS